MNEGETRADGPTCSPRERLLGSILDTVPAALLVFDREGRACFVNRLAREACSDVCGDGADPLALLDPDAAAAKRLVAAMQRGEQPCPFETTWSTRRGETRSVEWTYRRELDPSHGVELVICSGVDVTARERSQEAQRAQVHFLQNLIDTLPNPLFYKTVDGLYRGCNRAFEEMIGVPRDAIVGKTVYEISPKELADVYYAKDRELFENPGVQVYEARVRYANGDVRDVIYYKATYEDLSGKLAGLVGVFLDITDRKQAERELSRARDELELRVEERTAELAREKDRAEAADRTKGEFLNIASHELRTPLATLALTLRQVASRSSTGQPARPAHVDRMERQVARLTRMVTELLDVSRLEQGTLTIHPVPTDLRALVEDTIADLRPVAQHHALALHLSEGPLEVCADPDRIWQVISNLVDNALKYSPSGAPIEVVVGADDANVRVTVCDHGAPLAPGDRERLFHRFVRLRSAYHQEGLGLGLYISRAIAEQHGGTLGVETSDDGNCFYVELPLRGHVPRA